MHVSSVLFVCVRDINCIENKFPFVWIIFKWFFSVVFFVDFDICYFYIYMFDLDSRLQLPIQLRMEIDDKKLFAVITTKRCTPNGKRNPQWYFAGFV